MTRIQESKIGAWADASPQRGRDERRPLASACGLRSVEAFTLIEIMVVVGIIGIVMAMGIPSIYQAVKKETIRKAASDLEDLCRMARAQAIMKGSAFELVIRADGQMFVQASRAGAASPEDGAVSSGDGGGAPAPAGGTSMKAQLPDSVAYEKIKVDGLDYMASDETIEARIRFFPNGLCDDMRIVLRSDQNERRGLTLEITTGLTTVVTDQRELANW